MATSSSTSTLLVALKSSFIILMCIMAVALAYLLIMDGYSSCFDPNAWWTIAAVTNVLVFFAFIVVSKFINFLAKLFEDHLIDLQHFFIQNITSRDNGLAFLQGIKLDEESCSDVYVVLVWRLCYLWIHCYALLQVVT
ncbi:hypothetical protein E3N88_07629 [Mikania micrantha]|uniref:Uncharacterized protein n=1 Tax=Mikania micrantha TaxID=192012 RepID=A0A5N6PS26_9ASTR|nr:hypothetical protein E3N88_07629 [Mikania micrantha]